MTTPSQAYAMYLQATRQRGGGITQRKQWVILPPLEPGGAFLQFHREQPRLERRVQWGHSYVSTELMERDLPERIADLKRHQPNFKDDQQWQVQPIVTVQVTRSELKELHGSPKTPYQILKRAEKVARKLHGFTV